MRWNALTFMVGLPFGEFLGGAALDLAVQPHLLHATEVIERVVGDEVLHVRPDYIEHQLAHAVRDPNGRAYNRTAHLPERRKMMQQWADYLNKLRSQK